MTKQFRNRGWLAALTFATLFAPQTVMAQDPAAKDNRPMLFGFMVDGRMVQAQVVGGKVTATVARSLNTSRGLYFSQANGQSFPKEQMKVSKGLVRFMDKEGNVAAELTHWNGGGNLTVAPRRVPVRLGITLAQTKTPGNGQLTIPVDEVAPDGPADKAGMKPGDLITEINGQKPATEELLRKALKEKRPGDALKVRVLRGGKELELTAKLEAVSDKADHFGLVSDPLLGWRRQQVVRAKADIDMLAKQQAQLQALLKRQAATIYKVKQDGARLDLKSKPEDPKNKDAETIEVFRRFQSDVKKFNEKAGESKKELDAKLQELKAEEARQDALVWMNRVTQRGVTRVPSRVTFLHRNNPLSLKPALGRAEQTNKADPLRASTLGQLVLVDPTLTSKPKDNELGQQVRELEKRLARIEKLLEQGLSRQQEADRRETRERHLRNRREEIDAKVRELRRAEDDEVRKDEVKKDEVKKDEAKKDEAKDTDDTNHKR